MKMRDAVLTAVWAAAAMTVSLAVISPTPLTAEGEETAKVEKIVHPTLKLGAIQVTAHWAKSKTPLEGNPVLLVDVVNGSDLAATSTCKISLMTMAPGREFSRAPAMPVTQWEQELSISLKPGEKKTIELTIDKKLERAGSGYVQLQGMTANDTNPVITASFSQLSRLVVAQSDGAAQIGNNVLSQQAQQAQPVLTR